jgi:hypothetical protein
LRSVISINDTKPLSMLSLEPGITTAETISTHASPAREFYTHLMAEALFPNQEGDQIPLHALWFLFVEGSVRKIMGHSIH